MAKDTVKVTLTNISDGPRGIVASNGSKEILEKGETREVELSQGEADNIDDLKEWFKVGGKGKATKVDEPAAGATDYNRMSRGDLDDLAAQRSIDISGAGNKAEVIALLEAADKA